jgi:hypothetical protein
MTKRRRHTPDQIIRKLAEGNKLLAGGAELDEVCRHLQVAESTWHRWVAQYGGMKANDAKRLKELEVENTRVKRLLEVGVEHPRREWLAELEWDRGSAGADDHARDPLSGCAAAANRAAAVPTSGPTTCGP